MPAAPQPTQQANLRTLIHYQFGGLNLSDSAQAIADTEFVALQNMMPYANGNLAVFPGPLPIFEPTGHTIHDIWGVVQLDVPYILYQLSTGALYALNLTTYTSALITTGTTIDGLHFTKWQSQDANGNPEAVLFSDTNLGYGSWDGTSWTVLEMTLTGQCLCVYAGRVWVAVGNTVNYTAPDTYDDFMLADYGGTFEITEPSMNAPPISMLASQNWMYIVGNSVMALNNVQIQSVAGSATLSTTFFLTLVSSSIGIQTEKACTVYNNTLLISTNIGVYSYYGLVGTKITQNMGDNFTGAYYLSIMQVMGKTILFSNQGYCLMLDDGRWFNLSYATANGDPFTSPWTQQDTLIFDGLTGYITDGTAIYELGGDNDTAQTCFVHTKLYDAGNAIVNKQVTKFGVEYYQNQLLQPPLTNVKLDIAYQADGFILSSNVFTHYNESAVNNNFVRDTINLIDRYFSTAMTLVAPPGTSISGFYWQFQDSTTWP